MTGGEGRFICFASVSWLEIVPLKKLADGDWLAHVVGEVVGFGCRSDEPMQ